MNLELWLYNKIIFLTIMHYIKEGLL